MLILFSSPLEIPGTSIRPPDDNENKYIICKSCHRQLNTLKKYIDPNTKKVTYLCPFCGAEISK